MKIKKAKLHKVTVRNSKITVDGITYKQYELAEKIGVSVSIIQCRVTPRKNIADKGPVVAIQELLWLVENNLNSEYRIYKKDGKWITADEVREIAEVHISTAHRRCNDWEAGLSTDEQLLDPAPKSNRGVFSRRRGDWDLGDMQPRRDKSELGPAGTWEKKLPEPEDGTGVGTLGRGAGMNSHGGYYFGD